MADAVIAAPTINAKQERFEAIKAYVSAEGDDARAAVVAQFGEQFPFLKSERSAGITAYYEMRHPEDRKKLIALFPFLETIFSAANHP